MDRLRRSLRQSFRRRSPKESSDDPAKPYHWQKDEAAVRAGTCSFTVKYLGCVEVYESRGMQVCEEALKVLRNSRRRTIKGVLYVSGDGLRVVDADNKGLIVDQTIEKVSFCAPDRNHEKGFAYICRDGTTRRWMCHGFVASKDSGERLSHAVGCAFAVCLEQKQKRDREAQLNVQLQSSTAVPAAAVAAAQSASSAQTSSSITANPAIVQQQTVDSSNNAQRSFRRASLTERKQDPQNVIPAEKPPVKPTSHPNAVARPAANKALFERQGSLRLPASSNVPNSASDSDSFHRFNSLRLNQLPSNLARHQQQQSHSSSNAGVGAIWEGEESSISELCLQMSSTSVNGRTNGFNSPSHTSSISEDGAGGGQSSRWDKSFVSNNSTVNESWSPPPTSSVMSASNSSKAEEWLKTAANQAKMLQQYSRQTPPNLYAASPSFNSSPALAGSNSGGDSSTDSPQHWAAYSNAMDQFPPTPSHQASSTIQQQQRSSVPPHQVYSSDAAAATATATYGNHGHNPSNVVAWHQSVSFDVVDNFDNKWESLDKRRHSTSITNGSSNVTNPFSQESNAVRI